MNADQDIDLHGKVMMPGLIDCHVHCMASNLNLGTNAKMPNVLAVLRAIPIIEGMINRGFTSVRDAGGADWALAEATRTGLIKGPRIFPAGRAISQTGGHGDFRPRSDMMEPCFCSQKLGSISRIADGIDAVRFAVRDEIQKGASQIKIMASGGVASPNDPIHFLGYGRDEIRAMVEEANNAGTYVMAHAYTSMAIRRAVECGVRTIEHGNLADREAAIVLADHGAYAVPTLITYEALFSEGASYGFPSEAVAKINAVREPGMRALETLAQAGVKMGFGTDLLGESQRLQSEEFRLRAEVLGNLEAIRAATTYAAEIIMGIGRYGTITPGAVADLLVLDGNPLTDINVLLGQGEHMLAIMKDGKFHKSLV
ncbi:MAG: hypothetical protein ACD_23C00006G0003 [uncultured bacterium]|nr:MAG: hypothetical protein ACD_23C00006G0003 [uncultured bacterium]